MNNRNESIKILRIIFYLKLLLFGGILLVMLSLLSKEQLQLATIFNLFCESYILIYILLNFLLSVLVLFLITKDKLIKATWSLLLILFSLLIIGDITSVSKAVIIGIQQGKFGFPVPIIIFLVHLWASFLLVKIKDTNG